MATEKTLFIIKHGLRPYEQVVAKFDLPEILAVYGIIALTLETYVATSLWIKGLFSSGVISMSALSVSGVALSVYSIFNKTRFECGCGFLGDNEYLILGQKVLILLVLFALYRGRKYLF
jgi:hypothetical protein